MQGDTALAGERVDSVLVMSARVLLTLPLPDPARDILEGAASVTTIGHIPTKAELISALDGIDVVCSQLDDQIDEEVLQAASHLRCVSLFAVGYNSVDVEAATRHGVIVCNTPGVLTAATADCAMTLLLGVARRVVEGDRVMRTDRFPGWSPSYLLGTDLEGTTLGIVGMGRIGQAMAHRALAFGMKIAYCGRERNLDGTLAQARHMDQAELLETCGVVSLHCPLTDQTRHLIDEAALRSMRLDAILINTARGAVVDELALVRALREGWIAGAGLDVFENEPHLAPGLAECDNALFLPHAGSATRNTRSAMAHLCATSAVEALAGTLPTHCINPQAWEAGAPAPCTPAPASSAS